MTTIRRLPALWRGARTTVLTLAGFASLTGAAWMVAAPLGLLVAGCSFFALEYLSDDGR